MLDHSIIRIDRDLLHPAMKIARCPQDRIHLLCQLLILLVGCPIFHGKYLCQRPVKGNIIRQAVIAVQSSVHRRHRLLQIGLQVHFSLIVNNTSHLQKAQPKQKHHRQKAKQGIKDRQLIPQLDSVKPMQQLLHLVLHSLLDRDISAASSHNTPESSDKNRKHSDILPFR